MHYRVDVTDPETEQRVRRLMEDGIADIALSMPVVFLDTTRLNANKHDYEEAVVLMLPCAPNRGHMVFLRTGRVHEVVDSSELTAERLRNACLRAEAIAKLVNDALATRTLEREHFMGTPLPLVRSATDGSGLIAGNPALVKLLGYDDEEEFLTIDPSTQIYRDPEVRINRFKEITETGVMAPNSYSVLRKDGSVIDVVHQAAIVYDHLGEALYVEGSFVDITELSAVKRQVKALNQDLLAAHRKAGMAEMASGVMHNIGNALNSVKVSLALVTELVTAARSGQSLRRIGKKLRTLTVDDGQTLDKLAELVQLMSADTDRRREALEKELSAANGSVEHLSEVVTRQLRNARVTGATEPIELADLIQDAITLNIQESHVQVQVDLERGPAALIDKHLLLQVIGNLLRNAVHAVDAASNENPLIKVHLSYDAEFAKICVADNGVGIAPEFQEKLFDYGFTTKASGHGFGLHSSAIAIQQMGGELRHRSDGPGLGAAFEIVLPVVESEELAASG